jgi:capsular exopolysaccharide synthesis family protein
VALGLLRRWHFVLPLALLAGAAGFAAGWLLFPSKFVAEGKLKVLPRDNEGDLANALRTQASMVKSQLVLSEALKSPTVYGLPELAGKGMPVPYLQKALTVEYNQPTLGADEVHVSLSGDRADDVKELLGEILLADLKVNLAQEQERLLFKLAQLEAKRKDWNQELLNARKALDSDPEQRQKIARLNAAEFELVRRRNKLADLSDKLTEGKGREKRYQEQMKTAQGMAGLQAELEEELRKDAEYVTLRNGLRQVDEEIRGLRDTYSGAALERNLARPQARRAEILQSMKEIKDANLQIKLARLRAEIETMEEQIKGLEKDLAAEQRRFEEIRIEDPTTDVQNKRFEVSRWEDKLKKLDTDIAALETELPARAPPADLRPAPARVRILEEPTTPEARKTDKQWKMALLFGAAPFGLVVLLFLLAEYRSQRVYSSTAVAREPGLSLIGTLPAVSAAARRRGPSGSGPEQNALAEAVDRVRTSILHLARKEDLRVIMVTSAVGGEGKTTLASHLAASLARAWRKTLLIDADLRSPAASALFELPQEPGFSEGLRGEVEFDAAVRPTPLGRLWLLPAGRCDAHALQALAQDNVAAVFERLKEQFDFVVIDAGPVLPVADALLLGQHADAALFAVLRDVSRLPAVQAAQQKLESLGVRTLGAVVIGEQVDAYGRGVRAPAPVQ